MKEYKKQGCSCSKLYRTCIFRITNFKLDLLLVISPRTGKGWKWELLLNYNFSSVVCDCDGNIKINRRKGEGDESQLKALSQIDVGDVKVCCRD